jgi:hypothetical protein
VTHSPPHTWQPIQGWVGRYRCSICRVIAHRMTTDGAIKAAHGGAPVEAFRVYRCTKSGCEAGAVTRRPRQVCAEHAEVVR